MKRDVSFLIIVITAILAFLLGYSLAPTVGPQYAGEHAGINTPLHGDATSPTAVTPNRGLQALPEASAPGYE